MSNIDITSGDWKLVVDLEEGRVNSLRNKEILLLGSFQRIDEKKGSTHIGIFDKGGSLLENSVWKLSNKTASELEIVSEGQGLEIRQVFSFSNEFFIHKILIKNSSDEEKEINLVIKDYWSSDLGWQGLMFNGFDSSLQVRQGDFVNLRQLNEINIPGKPLVKWQLLGLNYAKFWVGFLEESGNKIFDTNYVCIEPTIEKDENSKEKKLIMPKGDLEIKQMIGVVYRT